jgi:hypothetical protein
VGVLGAGRVEKRSAAAAGAGRVVSAEGRANRGARGKGGAEKKKEKKEKWRSCPRSDPPQWHMMIRASTEVNKALSLAISFSTFSLYSSWK